MSLPRLRIRTLMIAVAAVGLALGGLAGLQRMDQRMRRFRVLSRHHQQQETVNRLVATGLAAQGVGKADVDKRGTLAEYHRALRLKYDRAALHPWQSVPPDPPEPK